MTNDDALSGFRLLLFALARGLDNVRAACRAIRGASLPPTTAGTASSCVSARRSCGRGSGGAPRMPTRIPPHIETRIVAFRARTSGLRTHPDLRGAQTGHVGRASWVSASIVLAVVVLVLIVGRLVRALDARQVVRGLPRPFCRLDREGQPLTRCPHLTEGVRRCPRPRLAPRAPANFPTSPARHWRNR